MILFAVLIRISKIPQYEYKTNTEYTFLLWYYIQYFKSTRTETSRIHRDFFMHAIVHGDQTYIYRFQSKNLRELTADFQIMILKKNALKLLNIYAYYSFPWAQTGSKFLSTCIQNFMHQFKFWICFVKRINTFETQLLT